MFIAVVSIIAGIGLGYVIRKCIVVIGSPFHILIKKVLIYSLSILVTFGIFKFAEATISASYRNKSSSQKVTKKKHSTKKAFKHKINTNADANYILPDANKVYYTKNELMKLNQKQLRIAVNEIYARHGRRFNDQDLQTYFDEKDWYDGEVEPDDFDESVLNKYEKANVKLIASLQSKVKTTTHRMNLDDNADYILPDDDKVYYTKKELMSLNQEQLRYAINEVYARHGRRFTDQDLQAYFDEKDWYDGEIEPDDFDESVLNKFEKANIKLMASLQSKKTTHRVNMNEDAEYILPDADKVYYTKKDIVNLDRSQISYAINEIYARHGRLFKNQYIQEYFDGKDWYDGEIEPEDFDESVLNKYEKANIDLLASFEGRG